MQIQKIHKYSNKQISVQAAVGLSQQELMQVDSWKQYKYTNTQIHKYTNIQIYKYTNIQHNAQNSTLNFINTRHSLILSFLTACNTKFKASWIWCLDCQGVLFL